MIVNRKTFKIFFFSTLLFASLTSFIALADINAHSEADEDVSIGQPNITLAVTRVAGAIRYHLQVRSENHERSFRTSSPDGKFDLNLEAGSYEFRFRTADLSNTRHPWGKWKKFAVPSGKLVNPPDNSEISARSGLSEKLSFNWPPGRERSFVFYLKNSTGEIVQRIETDSPAVSTGVRANDEYSWTVTPTAEKLDFDQPKIPLIWYRFTVGEPKSAVRVLISTAAGKQAKDYEFEITQIGRKGVAAEPWIFHSADAKLEMKLEPGAYKTRSRALLKNNRLNEWSDFSEIFITSPFPVLDSPKEGETIKATDAMQSLVTLNWQSVANADRYRVLVFDRNGKTLLSQSTSDTHLDIHIHDNMAYGWTVSAFFFNEKERELKAADAKSIHTFQIDRAATAVPIKLGETSDFYGWVRQTSAIDSYSAHNSDAGTDIRQSLFTSTGELALGYWKHESNLEYLVSGSLSGFLISNMAFVFKNASLLATPHDGFLGLPQLHLWAGASYREIPEIRASVDGSLSFERIQSLGPELRLIYAREVDNGVGWRLLATGYDSSISLHTPSGQAQEAKLSYSLGAQGTLRLSDSLTGIIGYSYQSQSATYTATSPGKSNSIDSYGHYFSVILVFGQL